MCEVRRGRLCTGVCTHLTALLFLQCLKHSFAGAYYVHPCLPSTCMSTSAHIYNIFGLNLCCPVELQAQPQLPSTDVAMPFVI